MAGTCPAKTNTIRAHNQPSFVMKRSVLSFSLAAIFVLASALHADAQDFQRELKLGAGATLTVINLTGRVDIKASADEPTVRLTASSTNGVERKDLNIKSGGDVS